MVPASPQQHGKTKKPVAPAAPTFAKTIRPLVAKYCVGCHSGASPSAGIGLDKFTTEASVQADRATWDRVVQNISSLHMPPAGAPHPSATERTSVVAWLQGLQAADCKLSDPGRVTMRRLNRFEYDNTVRDLTGLDMHLAADFPTDDVGYGFDNVGDVLSISPLLMEKYLAAADKIARNVIPISENKPAIYEGDTLKNDHGGSPANDGEWLLSSEGTVTATHDFPHTGSYRIRIKAAGQQAGSEPTKMAVHLDGVVIAKVDVTATEAKPAEFEFPIRVESGKHKIGAEFTNDYYKAGPPAEDRNLLIYSVQVENPAPMAPTMPAEERRIITHAFTPGDRKAAGEFLKGFASRAFRRPATPAEVDRLTQIADMVMKDGEPFERAIQVGVQAVLASPNFIFRVEREDGSTKLNSYELASRLSYFLWSSTPDDRLEGLAATGELLKPAVLEREAHRMLLDPRATSLADGFAAQWLNLRKLPGIVPDPMMFPQFSDKLRDDMTTETRLFFNGVVANDRSVLDFLDAKYTYINGRLAALYGIPNVEGDQFRKVSLAGTPRAGVLTQASVLTLTSNPTRTSPVKRGKWVLDELLNDPPPPPPPGVSTLKDEGHPLTGATMRLRMEQHRADPACATCHQRMDPIGFSLENFDATGRWRTEELGAKIDSSGVLPDGSKFSGATELTGILLKRKDAFVQCLADKLLTYALGRGVDRNDHCHVDQIATTAKAHEYRFSSLISAIVSSDAFRLRRPAATGAK